MMTRMRTKHPQARKNDASVPTMLAHWQSFQVLLMLECVCILAMVSNENISSFILETELLAPRPDGS